ncbi:MAG TPA: ankyrin repeat domain-containing protein [Candidatus Babeliales bacterium]|nr:ankyrin repeat domain-containing protein [Candidatus Babeliales bacterium]
MDIVKTMIISNLIMGVFGIPRGDAPQQQNAPHAVVQEMADQEEVKEAAQEPSPLFSAISQGQYEQAHQLIREGADVRYIDPRSKKSVLALAAEKGVGNLVYKLILAGADPDQSCPGWFNWTPLFFAVNSNQLGTTRVLLNDGASVDARDSRGFTPLMHRVQVHYKAEDKQRSIEVIKRLLKGKADPAAINKKGYPVSFYTQNEKVKSLLDEAQRLREPGQ